MTTASGRYLRLTVRTRPDRAEDVGERMMRAGAAGFAVADGDTDPSLAGAGLAVVTGWLPEAADARERAQALLGADGLDTAWESDPGWADAWRAGFRPVRAGRVVVRAPWNDPVGDGSAEVVIEPAMAFGTGAHATTRLALAALDRALAAAPAGVEVLDVGTGSGVLAIAALRLGAARAVGVDDDPVAVDAARDNAARNGVSGRSAWGPWAFEARFGVVVANIVSPVLLALRDRLVRALAPGGTLVLSGILEGEADAVAAAFTDAGLRLVARDALAADADWVALTLVGP